MVNCAHAKLVSGAANAVSEMTSRVYWEGNKKLIGLSFIIYYIEF